MSKRAPPRPVPDGPEPRATIRILHDCNFRCARCSTWSGPGRQGRMRLDHFKRAVDRLASERFHGTLTLSGGETTLHPRLPEMLAYAGRRLPHSEVVVFTNGTWVGSHHWKRYLRQLLCAPNVFVHYSLDRQHVEGAARAAGGGSPAEVEAALFARARAFVQACRTMHGNFRIAHKGTRKEADGYLGPLGPVPIYTIAFQRNPRRRRKTPGVFAIEVNRHDRVEVFPTLGHIPRGESLGGLETIAQALRRSRLAMRKDRLRAA